MRMGLRCDYSIRNAGRVLVVGPEFYNYLDNIILMFSEAGWDVRTINYRIESTRNPLKKISNRHKIFFLQEQITRVIEEEQFDLCVHIRGYDRLAPETYSAIHSKNIPMVLFLQDSIKQLRIDPKVIVLFSRILTFESTDKKFFDEMGVGERVIHFGVGYHPSYYFRIPTEKKYDIVFAGNIHKNERFELIKNFCYKLSNYKILIVSPFVSWSSPSSILKYIRYPYKRYLKSGQFGAQVINRLYNQSKIALNLQDPQNIVDFNPRTLEIWASGTLQLSKATKSLKELEHLNIIVLYETEEELQQKTLFYLENPAERKTIEDNALEYVKRFSFNEQLSKFLV